MREHLGLPIDVLPNTDKQPRIDEHRMLAIAAVEKAGGREGDAARTRREGERARGWRYPNKTGWRETQRGREGEKVALF